MFSSARKLERPFVNRLRNKTLLARYGLRRTTKEELFAAPGPSSKPRFRIKRQAHGPSMPVQGNLRFTASGPHRNFPPAGAAPGARRSTDRKPNTPAVGRLNFPKLASRT